MRRFAVFGSPIQHSLSPLIHYLFAKQAGIKLRYDKYQVEPENFAKEVNYFFSTGGCGLNITSPLKELAFQISDKQTPRCFNAKSANTLWYNSGQIYADNTDGAGLLIDLKRHINIENQNILIIGVGGAARGIIEAINSEKPKSISLLNRSEIKLTKFINDFSNINSILPADFKIKYDLIINTTPSAAEILPDKILQNAQFCYDLIYRYNSKTPFELRASQFGIPTQNGLGMLIAQAALAFAIWHNLSDFGFMETLEFLHNL